jgi:hypothetical protein
MHKKEGLNEGGSSQRGVWKDDSVALSTQMEEYLQKFHAR